MSAGHPHTGKDHRSPAELAWLRKYTDLPVLMKRFHDLDVDHDVPDGAGYNVQGTVRFIDRDFFEALLNHEHANKIGLDPIHTGLSPEQTVECILEHEAVEKALLDGDNPIDTYKAAHDLATLAEHEKVKSFGGTPLQYERALKPIFDYCERKVVNAAKADFACASMLEDRDQHDTKALAAMRKLGVTDASKESRASVGYGKSTSESKCRGCKHWQGHRSLKLSPCAVVNGLVRWDRWCRVFEDPTKA